MKSQGSSADDDFRFHFTSFIDSAFFLSYHYNDMLMLAVARKEERGGGGGGGERDEERGICSNSPVGGESRGASCAEFRI